MKGCYGYTSCCTRAKEQHLPVPCARALGACPSWGPAARTGALVRPGATPSCCNAAGRLWPALTPALGSHFRCSWAPTWPWPANPHEDTPCPVRREVSSVWGWGSGMSPALPLPWCSLAYKDPSGTLMAALGVKSSDGCAAWSTDMGKRGEVLGGWWVCFFFFLNKQLASFLLLLSLPLPPKKKK